MPNTIPHDDAWMGLTVLNTVAFMDHLGPLLGRSGLLTRSLVAENEMRPTAIHPRIKRSGGVRPAPVDGMLAFFRTIECDCAQ